MQNAIIACELGPNPAPIIELVWALARQRDVQVGELFLLTDSRGLRYQHELHHGLSLLEGVLGFAPRVHIDQPRDDSGDPVDTDLSPQDAQRWMEARWQNHRRAIAAADTDPVVFAIAANRDRSVLSTGLFTLLARPQDLCLDVRVSEPRVEGAKAGFYFPEQPEECRDKHGVIDPASVQVSLVEVSLPRLGSLLTPSDLSSHARALQAAQTAVEENRPPTLEVLLSEGRVLVDGAPVQMPAGPTVWLLALCMARQAGEGWIPSHRLDWLSRARDLLAQRGGLNRWKRHPAVFAELGHQEEASLDQRENLAKLKSVAARRMREWCAAHGGRRGLLVPEKRKVDGLSSQRLALPGRYIRLR